MDDEDVYGEPPSAVEIAALVAVLALAVGRFVANRARRTVVENAQEDPAHPKCRWVVEPDACDFCKKRGSFLYEPGETPISSHSSCKCHPDAIFGIEESSEAMSNKKRINPDDLDVSNDAFFGEHKTPIGSVIIDSGQFGDKSSKHMRDYGFDSRNANDRDRFRRLVLSAIIDPDSIRDGFWSGFGRYPAMFYIRDEAVIIVKKHSGEYVSILKGGEEAHDEVRGARTVFRRR